MTSSKTYEIIVSSLAKRQLKKLPLQLRKVVGLCLDNLATCPRPQNCIKLKSRPGYRIRIGVHRVIYEVEDKKVVVFVIAIGHRRDIYN